MTSRLYSIRMRAAAGERHISGAERLGFPADLPALAANLTERALLHERGLPDVVTITLEQIDNPLDGGRLPDITTVHVADVSAGRQAALAELIAAGVAAEAAAATIGLLAGGAASDGGGLRGALLVDARSGERLDPLEDRGVRVSRMDLTPAAAAALELILRPAGLDNPHVREALVLAAKVRLMPGFVAEICWSDDPSYTAGYVSTPGRGYVRYPHLKEKGALYGGRAFFCAPGSDADRLIRFLEKEAVIFSSAGVIRPDEAA